MHNIIHKDSVKPLYQQLRDWIESSIKKGDFFPGSRLPSENQFSKCCGIHRNTVRNALSLLEQEGLLRSVPGSGWFVHPGEQRLRRVGQVKLSDSIPGDSSSDSSFNMRIRRGLAEGAALHGFEIVRLKDKALATLLLGRRGECSVDALLVTDFQVKHLEQLRLLKASALPLLVFNQRIFGEGIPCVCIDQYYSTRDLVACLIQNGHSRIGCITMALDGRWKYALERYRGYADALSDRGLPADRKLLCQVRSPRQSRRKIRDFLKNSPDMTALFIAGEIFHHCTLDLLRKQGRRIPDDLSVVAFDRVEDQLEQSVISLDQPLEEIGRRAFCTLDMMLAGQPAPGEMLLPVMTAGNSIRSIK